MEKKVSRHVLKNTDIDLFVDAYTKMLDKNFNKIREQNLPKLDIMSSEATELYILQLYQKQTGEGSPEQFKCSVREYMNISMDCVLAMFKLALNKGKETEFSIGNTSMTASIVNLGSWVDSGNWRLGWNLAHILRRKDALDILLAVPDKILRLSTLTGDEYHFLYVDFLKSLYLEPKDAKSKLMKAYKAADPDILKRENPIYALNYTSREMEIYSAFLMEDNKKLNQSIISALESHKYMVELDNHQGQINELISLPITGAAAFAYHNGYKIEVESDYMPKMLVEGNF
jgi:hypothetical protein